MKVCTAVLCAAAAVSVAAASDPPPPDMAGLLERRIQPGELRAQTETLTARIANAPLSEDERSSVIEAIAKHDYAKAAQVLVKAIQRKPRSAELLTASAGLFFIDRQYLNTAIVLKRAEKIAPLTAADRLLLALAYIAMQHNDWARPELEKLAAQDPASIAPTYWLARIDYDERRYNEAIEKLRAVTTAQPAFLRGWDNLALAFEGAGLLEDAASAYEKAVELNRAASAPSVWPPLNYATLLERVGRIADAEKLLAEAARYDPKSAQVHYRLGLAHEKSGRDSAAIDEFREAANLDAKYADPLYALARLFYKKGDTASAESTMAAYRRVKSGRVIPGH